MSKLNNKGFAVSTILYGILALTILILMLIFGVMKATKDMNQDLANSIENNINNCASLEVKLENCYYEGGSCLSEKYEYDVCTGTVSTLKDKILSDNDYYPDDSSSKYVSSSTGINFGNVSSSTNGQGLYYTSTNTEGNGTTYYFRGKVTNNYVSFANHTWRIIRINEDGSIRIITQNNVGESVFNSNHGDNAYVGYMYGATGSLNYADTHKNLNNSTIKTYLDDWYVDNLSNYTDYLDGDAGFCNDRSIYSGLGYGQNPTYLGVHRRIISATGALTQQYACPNANNDLFTTGESGKGNKALNYPIGLITADEVVYAGGLNSMNASNQNITTNNNYYLYTGSFYWTMSGGYFHNTIGTFSVPVYDSGLIAYKLSNEAIGVRPVINLKGNVTVLKGDGTSANPYVIWTI